MKRFFLCMMTGAALSASAVAPFPGNPMMGGERSSLAHMRKARTSQSNWSRPGFESAKKIAPAFSTPKADSFQYLEGPDGSEWYAICNYDVETRTLEGGFATEKILKGYTFTIYDSHFNEVGTVKDEITLEGNETRCAQAMLDISVTKKFFNYDNDYEVMVALSMNTPDYTVNTRTKVYAIKKSRTEEFDTPLAVIPGYPVDAINVAGNSWSEDFFITFLTEKTPDPDADYETYLDFLGQYYQVLTTYTKAGTNGYATPINVKETQMLCLPGDQMSSPTMLANNAGGKLTLTFARYEKSLFEDPSGMGGNEALTADNNLVIETYQLNNGYPKTFDLISSTLIPTERRSDDSNVLYTFYGIGNLRYGNDVDFGHYTADGKPSYVVSVDEYLISDDDNYNSSYYVYDSEGKRIRTIAEDTFNFVNLSDVAGCEPQAMFIRTGDEMVFDFVDLYSGKSVCKVDQMYRGNPLTTSIDRVPTADGYAYAVATGYGDYDEEGNLLAPVLWIDSEGEMIRLDGIPAGKGVEMAQIYMSQRALSPYVFNTDTDLEYMLLVKRRVNPTDAKLREEFLIASVRGGVLHTFLPDEEKGAISTVYLMGDADKELIVAYQDTDHSVCADSYPLPFTKFAGGEGLESDPYIITTAGDLCQMHSDPAAHYVLGADIDCAGVGVPMTDNFTGSLNGKGHAISNLYLEGAGKTALFGNAQNARFESLEIKDATMLLTGDSDAALLCVNPTNCKIEGIHVNGLNVGGETFTGSFGTIAGKAWTMTEITECKVADACIDLPGASPAGGIVGATRTGTSVKACAFLGSITADNMLGGIAGTISTGDEKITSCHSDAVLKAKNTVGGIVGFMKRAAVSQCYAEGSIEATEPDKWTNALAAGGIAGELEGDWEKTGNAPIVKNLVGISEIKCPALSIEEKYPHQLATVHRVVGRTSYNAEPEVDRYDNNGNPIYKKDVIYEYGVKDNLVVSTLACIDSDFDGKTVEGTSIDRDDLNTATLAEKLGFAFGQTADAPWDINAEKPWDPQLYIENTSVPDAVKEIASASRIVAIVFAEGIVTAPGCIIKICDLQGRVILTGRDAVNCSSLAQGIFIATATPATGSSSSVKIRL